MTHFTLADLNPVMRRQAEAKLRAAGTVRRHRLADEKELEAKTNKHHAESCVVDGIRFDSKWELRCWVDLKAREKAGEIRGLRRQVKFALFMQGGEAYGTYTADFVFEEAHGVGDWLWRRVIADAKSKHTCTLPAWQKVKKLMLNNHGIEVRELVKGSLNR